MACLPTCTACGGFVVDVAAPCVHCGAIAPRRRALWRALAVHLLGAASAVTLMACYGMTYDCADPANNCMTDECTADVQCAQGSICDLTSGWGHCVWTGTCYEDSQCAPGLMCDVERGTCVPVAEHGCTSHADCDPPLTRCDPMTDGCVPTTGCGPGTACGVGARCDPAWSICVPCAQEACGVCAGELTCTDPAPDCGDGLVPAVADGCYTGACLADATCVAEACAPLTEVECAADPRCLATYRGIDCTGPDGGACTPEACTCAAYEYDACVPAADPPPP